MLAFIALCSAPFPAAHAGLVLGEVVSQSVIGDPLRVEIRLLGGKSADIRDCLRIAALPPSSDGITVVTNARLSSTSQGAATSLVLSQPRPVSDPIVRLAIDNICQGGLRREYTLLLAFPELQSLAATSPVADHDIASGAQIESLRPQRSAAPALKTARATPAGSPATPAPARAARPATQTARTAAAPQPTPEAPTSQPGARKVQDRLVLMGDNEIDGGLRFSFELADPGRIGQTSESERELLRREYQLVSALDRSIMAQMELNHRLTRLEEIQAALAAEADLPTPDSATAPAPDATPTPAAAPAAQVQPDAQATSGWLIPLALFAGLSLLGAGLLWFYQRRLAQRSASQGFPATLQPEFPVLPGERDEPVIATGAAAPARNFQVAATPTLLDGGADALVTADEGELARLEGELTPQEAIDEILHDEAFDEHDSTLELADIMLSLGRVRGAAETLAELVFRAPRHSLTPWLKLLKAYRMAGMRTEFETLAGRLNKTFNVHEVSWDEFDEMHLASDSVEQMPHIVRTLVKLWGTRECQAYLDHLLRDNRDGTRQGFPLGVTDDILTLAGILEDRLGRYIAPVTETSAGEAPASGDAPTTGATEAAPVVGVALAESATLQQPADEPAPEPPAQTFTDAAERIAPAPNAEMVSEFVSEAVPPPALELPELDFTWQPEPATPAAQQA